MRLSTFFASISVASAGRPAITPSHNIPADSRLGSKILSKSRLLDGGDGDMSWVAGYSIKFVKCATSTDYYGGYFGGNGNGNNGNGNGNGNNGDRNNFNGVYEQRLVHFKLCPSDSCDSCEGGADYVTDMNEFVELYVQSKLSAQEYSCELVRENCYCENANDDEACEYQCYQQAGLDYCGDYQKNNDNGQYQFDLEEAVECAKMDVDDEMVQYYLYKEGGNQDMNMNYYNGNRNGNGEMGLFVGPYCSSNGKSIHMGVFRDETCSFEAPSGIYEKLSYGQSLPYSSESLIDSGCVSCAEPKDYDQQNYYDQQDDDEVTDVCERLYEEAGKCETDLNIYYPNTYACNFIASLKVNGSSLSIPKISVTPKVLAGVFGATTAILGGMVVYLWKKSQRQNVTLSDQGGEIS